MATKTMSPLRAALLGAAAGATAATLAYFTAQGVGVLAGRAAPAPDANIGLGMAMAGLQAVLTPLAAWPLLRVLEIRDPGRSVLFSLPFHIVGTGLVLPAAAAALDPAPPFGFVGAALAFAAAAALGVLTARAAGRRRGVRV